MPGLCAVLHASPTLQTSRLEVMARRMQPYPWFRRRQDDPTAGFGLAPSPSTPLRRRSPADPTAAGVSPSTANSTTRDGSAPGFARPGSSSTRRPTPPPAGRLASRGAGVSRAPARDHSARSCSTARRASCMVITDRFGLRPLYVARAGNRLVASEIKALLAEPGVSRARSTAGHRPVLLVRSFLQRRHASMTAVRAVPGGNHR